MASLSNSHHCSWVNSSLGRCMNFKDVKIQTGYNCMGRNKSKHAFDALLEDGIKHGGKIFIWDGSRSKATF